MASRSVRDIPEELDARIVASAAAESRSINKQIIVLLERGLQTTTNWTGTGPARIVAPVESVDLPALSARVSRPFSKEQQAGRKKKAK